METIYQEHLNSSLLFNYCITILRDNFGPALDLLQLVVEEKSHLLRAQYINIINWWVCSARLASEHGKKRYIGEWFLFLFIHSLVCLINASTALGQIFQGGEQSLAKIDIHKAVLVLRESASIKASPYILGQNVMYSHHLFLNITLFVFGNLKYFTLDVLMIGHFLPLLLVTDFLDDCSLFTFFVSLL